MKPFSFAIVGLLLAGSCVLILQAQEAPQRIQEAETHTVATSVRQGPALLTPAEYGVGRFVPDCAFSDLSGGQHRLSEFSKRKLLVVAMTSTSCPLSRKYLPTLVEFAHTYSKRGVQFVLVNPVAADKPEDMQEAQKQLGDTALYVVDQKESLARAVGALTTTDVVVLDPSRTVVYHGAIDDQYGLGYSINAPRQRYLSDAVNSLLDGREPVVAATDAPGCALDIEPATSLERPLTWNREISRLVQRHCVECHRDGGVGPFALDTYDDFVAHAPMIRQVVENRTMPPWFAVPQSNEESSPWINDRSLAAAEKESLLNWIAKGRAEGDPQEAPQPKTFPEGWLIGKPDAVFEFAKPEKVKATGIMPYQNVVVDTDLVEDKWVQAIEVRPGNPSVVHHVLVFAESDEEESPDRDAANDERSGYWGIYVPGNSTLTYPDGYARRIPKGARLRFQMHYTPNGTATEDQTRIGLVFARKPPQHEVRVAGIANARINIPPGADNHQEVATLRIPADVQVLAFLPHMHLRGKAARYEVVSSSGTEQLLDIPRYDFNWQLLYRYADPLSLKQGDTLRFTAWYDNSAGNPANPDPAKAVRWGPQTYDEMMLGYVEYIVPGAKPGEPVQGLRRAAISGAIREGAGNALFQRLDVNADGEITKAEVRARMPDNPRASGAIFDRLDKDSNGKLDKTEFSSLQSVLGQ